VLAGRQQPVGAADAHAHPVRQPLGDEVLRRAVAGYGLDVEADLDAGAVAIGVGGGEIAQDAAADLPPLGLHADRLGDRKVAVALDHGIADEQQDALCGRRRRERREKEKGRDCSRSRRDHGWRCVSSTFGAAASLRSSSSKNGSGLNPRTAAIRLLGNDWMLMFKLRTVPL
jgi:hypothetical protein